MRSMPVTFFWCLFLVAHTSLHASGSRYRIEQAVQILVDIYRSKTNPEQYWVEIQRKTQGTATPTQAATFQESPRVSNKDPYDMSSVAWYNEGELPVYTWSTDETQTIPVTIPQQKQSFGGNTPRITMQTQSLPTFGQWFANHGGYCGFTTNGPSLISPATARKLDILDQQYEENYLNNQLIAHDPEYKDFVVETCDKVVQNFVNINHQDPTVRVEALLDLFLQDHGLRAAYHDYLEQALCALTDHFDPDTGELLLREGDPDVAKKIRPFVDGCWSRAADSIYRAVNEYAHVQQRVGFRERCARRFEKTRSWVSNIFSGQTMLDKIRSNRTNQDFFDFIQLCKNDSFEQAYALKEKYRYRGAIANRMSKVYNKYHTPYYQARYDEYGVERCYADDPWWRDMAPETKKEIRATRDGIACVNRALKERSETVQQLKSNLQMPYDCHETLYVLAGAGPSEQQVRTIFNQQQNKLAPLKQAWSNTTNSPSYVQNRLKACDQIEHEAKTGTIVYRSADYAVSQNASQKLLEQNIAPRELQYCYGNALQHSLHTEFVCVVEKAATIIDECIGHSPATAQLLKATVRLAGVGTEFTKAALIEKAAHIADRCQRIYEHPVINMACAPVEGLALGTYNTVANTATLACNLVTHPRETAVNMVAGCAKITWMLLEEMHEGGAYLHLAEQDYDAAQSWVENRAPTDLQKITIACCRGMQELPPREIIKQGVACATEWTLTPKLHRAVGKCTHAALSRGLEIAQSEGMHAASQRLQQMLQSLDDGYNDFIKRWTQPSYEIADFGGATSAAESFIAAALGEAQIAKGVTAAQAAIARASAAMAQTIARIAASGNNGNRNNLPLSTVMEFLDQIAEVIKQQVPASAEVLRQLAQDFLHNAHPALAEHRIPAEKLDELRKLFAELPPILGIDVEHSLNYGYNAKRKATTGYHMASRNPENIIELLELPDKNGVWKAWIKAPSHKNGKYSTFFPIKLNEQEIMQVCKEAICNIYEIEIRDNFIIKGYSKIGIEIQFYLNENGIIESFFALMEKKL